MLLDGRDAEPIGRGRSAEVYRTPGGRALKLFSEGVSEERIRAEVSRSRLIHRLCAASPRCYGYERRADRFAVVYELLEGPLLSDLLAARPLALRSLARKMARTHLDIHEKAGSGLRSNGDKLTGRIRGCPAVSDAVKSRLLSVVSRSEADRLCHGDFHPENIIVEKDGRFRVLDWENACSGDPMFDVARTAYLIGHGVSPVRRSPARRVFEWILGSFFARAYRAAYLRGHGPVSLESWAAWSLIVRICRTYESIPEEKRHLRRAIRHGATLLMRTPSRDR